MKKTTELLHSSLERARIQQEGKNTAWESPLSPIIFVPLSQKTHNWQKI